MLYRTGLCWPTLLVVFLCAMAIPGTAHADLRFYAPNGTICYYTSISHINAGYREDGQWWGSTNTYWRVANWNDIKKLYATGKTLESANFFDPWFLSKPTLQTLQEGYLVLNNHISPPYMGCITLDESNIPSGSPILERIDNGPIYFRGGSGSGYDGFARPLLVTDKYFPKGNLQINITPSEAVADGAKWSMPDIGEEEFDSGYTYSSLDAGVHTIQFKAVPGWRTPSSRQVTVNADTTTTIHMEYDQGGTAQDVYPVLSLLLLSDEEVYEETNEYYKLEKDIDGLKTVIAVFKGASDIDRVVVSKTLSNTVVMTNYYPMSSFTRVVITTNKSENGFHIDLANTSNVLSHLSDLVEENDAANKVVLTNFAKNHAPRQVQSGSFNGVEINIPKTIAPFLSTTTYKSKIMDSVTTRKQLRVLDDDPITGWYFDDTVEVEYEYLEITSGSIVILQEPILFNGSYTKVRFQGEPLQAFEKLLFKVDDLEGGLITSKDSDGGTYNVGISHWLMTFDVLYQEPAEFEKELYTYVLSYTADGKCSLDPDVGTPVYLSTSNMNYKVDVAYGQHAPDPTVYSCLGSVDSETETFGDGGFSLIRIWIAIIPR